MLDWMAGRLLRRTGHDVPWWREADRQRLSGHAREDPMSAPG